MGDRFVYIDDYLERVLMPLLVEYKLKYRFVVKICDDIRNRMISLLSIWNDKEKRNAILFLTLEEAPFYLPKANPFVAEFVIATIRNSMFELAASDNCHKLKMAEPLSDKQIKEVTSSAIVYFNNCTFDELIKEIPRDWDNLYENAIQRYPIAWEALLKLSNMQESTLKLVEEKIYDACEVTWHAPESSKMKRTIFDGYSLAFDERLSNILNKIISGEMNVFFVDCSKMLTRNFEKYLQVLEIILKSNATLCTCNYYINNACLEKRKRFLRAAHCTEDILRNMRDMVDAPPNIQKVVESFNYI